MFAAVSNEIKSIGEPSDERFQHVEFGHLVDKTICPDSVLGWAVVQAR